MAQLFYDENDPRKKREMRGDKTPIAMNDGPSTPIKFDKGMNKYMPNLGGGRLNDDKIRFKKKIPKA
tara:strand:+ start:238 stop:438 length:201 start_codon:yes stop_codon:yes gene_type:complete